MSNRHPEPITVTIIADGEDALRLFRRVRCAARALHLDVIIEEHGSRGKPAQVKIANDPLFEGLQRIEDIEQFFKDWSASHQK